MKKLWLALLFFAGGVAHEVRNPVNCHLIASRRVAKPESRSREYLRLRLRSYSPSERPCGS